MHKKRVYILHKNGANSHYIGLERLLKEHDITLEYREFSVFSKLFKGLTKRKVQLVQKQLTNMTFFVSLLFSKNKKVVLGIAPYDSKLKTLLFFLKNHTVYYHTSWSCWDKTFQPKRVRNPKTLLVWKRFIEEKATHIFAVTTTTKQELIANYNVTSNHISVVKHSIDNAFLNTEITTKSKNSFVYYGRLVPQKGIDELLAFFKKNTKATLTFIGEGSETQKIKVASQAHQNIHWLPYFNNKSELAKALRPFEYLVVNSLKTNKWEELFGMVIIEGMSQGLVPIATNHTGPKEIITPQLGYLCEEGKMSDVLLTIINMGETPYEKVEKLINASKEYTVNHISKNWKAIL